VNISETIALRKSDGRTGPQIAEELNDKGFTTRTGLPWTAEAVNGRYYHDRQVSVASTVKEADLQRVRVEAMTEYDRSEWGMAKATRERDKARDEQRRAKLGRELDALRAEGDSLAMGVGR
jgi:hypothetical protein